MKKDRDAACQRVPPRTQIEKFVAANKVEPEHAELLTKSLLLLFEDIKQTMEHLHLNR